MVFVITGAGSGIGEMMANALDANGASKVYILGRRKDSVERVASEANSLAVAAGEVAKQSPFVNAVIANSGIGGPADALIGNFSSAPTLTQLQEHLWSTDQSEANSVSQINTIGPYFTFLAFLKLLEAGNTHPSSRGKDGYIPSQFITNSSIAGLSRANMYGYPYSASKAGLIHLTKMLSTEFAFYGIRANTIAPGLYVTEVTAGMVPAEVPVDVPGNLPKEVNPSLRVGTKEDIAGIVLYLVSRAGGFVNGSVPLSDGGLSIRQAAY